LKVNCEDVAFQLKNIKLCGQRWHKGAKHRVIALHGWLDSCATYGMLLPLLPDIDCVALDMAGHGLSEYRSQNSSYNIWKDVPEILEVVNQLGWEHFSIMGHSRGAMVSTVFAGTFPEKIERIVLIDAVAPIPIDESELPKQLASAIEGEEILKRRKSTMWPTYDEAAEARTSGRFPLSVEASRLLATRAVEQSDEGFYWRYDPWLLISSEIKLITGQVKAFVDQFPSAAHVILATEGVLPDESRPAWIDEHPLLDIDFLDGEHHLQLSKNPETIQKLAAKIDAIFNTK